MQNQILVLTGPTCGGKSTIAEYLLEVLDYKKIVTSTSRDMREGEIHGRDYYFLKEEYFENNLEKFVEIDYHNNAWYGVEKNEIETKLQDNNDYLVILNEAGVRAYKNIYGNRVVSVYVYAPKENLKGRIKERYKNRPRKKKERLNELNLNFPKGLIDYKIFNPDGKLEKSKEKIERIINGEI